MKRIPDRLPPTKDAAAASRPVSLPVGVVGGSAARQDGRRRGEMPRGTSHPPPLLLVGGLHGAGHDAVGLVPDRHLLRFLREETGNQPGLSARWLVHEHVPHGDVVGRQLHHGHRAPG